METGSGLSTLTVTKPVNGGCVESMRSWDVAQSAASPLALRLSQHSRQVGNEAGILPTIWARRVENPRRLGGRGNAVRIQAGVRPVRNTLARVWFTTIHGR